MANINLHERHPGHVCAISNRLGDTIFVTFDLEHLEQGHFTEKRDLRHSIANINLHKSHTDNFCASSYRLQDINILNF